MGLVTAAEFSALLSPQALQQPPLRIIALFLGRKKLTMLTPNAIPWEAPGRIEPGGLVQQIDLDELQELLATNYRAIPSYECVWVPV